MAESEIIGEDDISHQNDDDSRDEELEEVPIKSTDDTPGGEVGFCIVENGTICGRRKLIDTRGYTYNVRRVKDSRTYWWCSVRNKTMYCKASVIQLGEKFRLGSKEHCHEPKPEVKAKKKRKPAIKSETTKTEEKKCLALEEQTDGTESQPECHITAPRKKLKQNLEDQKHLEVKYRIINEGTRCGKRKLVDSLGFEYNVKCIKNDVTYWWCAVRNKTTHCRATVSQRGDNFKIGKIEHCHEAVFKPKMKLAVIEEVPASLIIEKDEDDNFEIPGESLTFHVLTKLSKSKGLMLVDSEGFTYRLKRQKEDQAYWICGEQGKSTRCSATVSQRGNKFRFGKVEHCHKPVSLPELREAYVGTRSCAAFSVNEVVAKCLDLEMLEGSNLDKAQEDDSDEDDHREPMKERKKQRDINTEYIPPHFLQKDIRIDNEQHLVLAFKEQMDLLSKAQVWYLDTGVRLVSEPFVQLFTITTCIQIAEEIGHVPLAFILMSRCQGEDYLKVFEFIKEVLPHPLVVNTFVASVDEALWEAVVKVFPDRKLQGCPYQWGKVIWQKVEELGLQAEYYNEDQPACVINSVLALPFLPYEHIELAFRQLRDQIRGVRKFEILLDYIDVTWISNSSWNLSSWSTFMQPVRTRDDIESWHIDMPIQNGKPTFYGLMWQLLQEAKLVPGQVQIICDEKLSSYQRNNPGTTQKQFYYLWDMYSAGDLGTNSFLEEIGMVCFHVNKLSLYCIS